VVIVVKFIKIIIPNIVLCTVIFSVSAMAGESIKLFSIAKSAKGIPTVVGSLYIDKKFTNVSLLEQTGQEPRLKVLSDYYQLGQANKGKAITELSFTPDGSHTWMTNELNSIPDKFSGFQKLDKVVATNLIRWGEYSVYGIDWYFAGNRKVGSWLESVICPSVQSCKLSNLVLNGSKNSELFSVALQEMTNKAAGSVKQLKHQLSIFPLYGKKKFPLDIHFNVNWLSKPMILGDKNDKSAKGDLMVLHQYLVELKKTQALKLKRQEADKVMMAQIGKYWGDFEPQKLFPVVKGDEVSHYPPLVFLQRLNNLQTYEVYGVLEAEQESYVIGSGVFNGHKALFVLPIDNSNAKLKQQLNNDALRDLIFTPQFYQTLSSIIKSKGLASF
jgi:hypothetical protein